jgi:hypothetical protein
MISIPHVWLAVSRCLLVGAMVTLPGTAPAHTDFSAGKTPEQLFNSSCSGCHRSPYGMAHGRNCGAKFGPQNRKPENSLLRFCESKLLVELAINRGQTLEKPTPTISAMAQSECDRRTDHPRISVAPEILKARRGQLGVAHRVLNAP